MVAVCTLRGDRSAHAIVFRASLTIGGKEHFSGARMNTRAPQLTARRLVAMCASHFVSADPGNRAAAACVLGYAALLS